MRRYQSPFNGNRYLLNLSTGEIHDLDCEPPQCNIDAISPENIYNCESYMSAEIWAHIQQCPNPNGYHYCNLSKDNG